MAQNIYDDPAFFEGYSQFPRSREGLAAANEWPALRAMLPDLNGKRVLDLGCGFGAFARFAAAEGANSVLGIDLSEKMLETARERTDNAAVAYQRGDLDKLDLGDRTFDVVFSSLAFHYAADFATLARTIRAALTDGGALVFSVEHPLFAVRTEPEFSTDAGGKRVFLVDDYLGEGKRVTSWVVDGVEKYHRTIATYINSLLDAGFSLSAIDEWGPGPELLAQNPDYIDHRIRPMFLLMGARATSR
ncbi:class I SAM-dependent methyltransferase [Pelagibacterium sp. H642]|uniref:class I SAM-dependent methyltransferase n=1 Tax=Pelagibacterium sp. H642 TaxID=1881069 RepID=UPI0028167608|nr:class I SAM-dependent methyltransferase [Pelagibacterium sp. H642]WMT89240.1 class I SAM-dependent methyltransferase [Pelagibacterium sp. H642]